MSQILQQHTFLLGGDLCPRHLQPVDDDPPEAMESIEHPGEVLANDEVLMFRTRLHLAPRIECI